MPFHKRTVEPIHLSQVQVPNDIPNELECVANHTLITDASHILQRTEALHGRIERLKIKVTQLDSNIDEGRIFYD
jgi:hypothetical protein